MRVAAEREICFPNINNKQKFLFVLGWGRDLKD